MGLESYETRKTKQSIIPTIVIPKSTLLTGSYNGGVCGLIDLTGASEQIVVYVEWTYGSAEVGNELYAKIRFSATNDAFGITPHEIIGKESAVSLLIEKEWRWQQQNSFNVWGEYLGRVKSGSNSKRLSMYHTPQTGSVSAIYHNLTAYGTVTEVAANANFTTPSSMAADTVEWSLATGDLNFNSTDLAADDGEEIRVDYTTTTNVIRIPVPVRDRFAQIILREWGTQTNYGTVYAYVESNWR